MRPEEIFTHIVGRIAQGVRPNDPVTTHYARLLRQFGEHVLGRWSAVSASGVVCTLRLVTGNVHQTCNLPAAGPCIACGHMVCVGHAMASPTSGALVCLACMQKLPGFQGVPAGDPPNAGAGADPPPPTEEQVAAMHLRTLGLPPTATLPEVKRRFRELSKTHHPDAQRNRSPAAHHAAEAHYKELTEAFNWLLRYFQERDAA